MQGLHLTADLYQCRCDPALLTDAQKLGDWCLQAVAAAGLQAVNQLFHAGGQGSTGVSATVLLPQSHICLHTWPEQRGATADVYVSNVAGDEAAKARELMAALVSRFQPEWTEQRSLDRGDDAT